jgi:PAS domain S-box-containing protein
MSNPENYSVDNKPPIQGSPRTKLGRKYNEAERGKFLLELYQKALLLSKTELNNYFLDHAVSLTGSTIGFFHFISEDQKSIKLTAWNNEALKNCEADYSTHYSIELAGNWVDCIRLKHPVIYNDYEKSPNQKGFPSGHVLIKRFMSIPIIENDKVKIVFGVGNKADPYTQDDVIQLQLVANELSKIYKQRDSEDMLRESEQRWSTTLSSIGDAVIATDIFGNITFMNKVAEELTGWALSVVHQRPLKEIFRIINEKTREEVENPAVRVLKEGMVVGLANHTILIREDGSEVPIDDSGAPIKDKDGKTTGVVLIFRDITERRNIEAALKKSEAQLRLKLDSVLHPEGDIGEEELTNIIDVQALQSMMDDLYATTKIGFALIDLKGNVLVGTGWQDICTKFHRVNPLALKNCIESDLELTRGVKQGEIRRYKCKNNIWDIVTPLMIGEKHVGNVFFGQYFYEDEIVDRNVFKSQAEKYGFNMEEYLWAFDRVPRFSKVKIENLMVFYSKLADLISKLSFSNLKLAKSLLEGKEMHDKLEQYAKHLEVVVEEKTKELKDAERLAAIGQTAGMVGHDIRNPLQAITSDVYLAKIELSSIQESNEKKNALESLQEIEKNVDYINKIVADLQDFARPLRPTFEEANLKLITDNLLAKFSLPVDVNVSVKIESDAMKVVADSTYVNRIMYNLVNNAVQAMPKGGELIIRAFKEANYSVITVKDTGVGISESVKNKLFVPMFTTKSKGQGFGLAVIKRMTEALGGTVTFESQEGKGTTFIIRLPPRT